MSDRYIAVARADDIAEGQIKGFTVDGKKIVVCKHAGQLHALDGVCSHAGGPLARGELDDGVLVCPWHGWEFNVESGVCEIEPTLRQKKFAVKVENGDVLVAVPADL